MSNDPFKYVKKEWIENANDPVVYYVTAETVQEFAEANINRRLTEKELDQLKYGFWDDQYTACDKFMDGAIQYAIEAAKEVEPATL